MGIPVTADDDVRVPTVLVVEDDDMLATRLCEYLGARAMTATPVDTLASARQLLKRHQFDAVVLDLNLGEHDGLALARELAENGGPPVVIASSRIDESDRVLGLELGADDYLVKPYSFRELLARIKVVLRRTRQSRRSPARRVATFGRWTFDATALRLADESGREVIVTGGEMALLRVFIEHPDRVLLRSQILALTKRSDAEVFDRAIDVLVGRLRRKIEEDPKRPRLILTVRGEGYRFTARVHWSASPD
jgi:two-component system, OmpR family, response regulator